MSVTMERRISFDGEDAETLMNLLKLADRYLVEKRREDGTVYEFDQKQTARMTRLLDQMGANFW